MYKTPEYKFWNNSKIVKEFSETKVSPYWIYFLEDFKKPSSYKVLDLGCGGGRNTEFLVKSGFDTWACDFYSLMLKTTKKKIASLIGVKETNRRIIQASMFELPFKKEYFNIVIANGVYHNTNSIEEFVSAIKETARVLKKGGFLCLNVFYKGIVVPEFKKIESNKNTFITHEGLHMTLIKRAEILKILASSNIFPWKNILSYKRNVNTGARSVFRGVFKKVT
ncbi:MAG: class I SAM-dependent methyltransferase [Patescibacteria group bacterium]